MFANVRILKANIEYDADYTYIVPDEIESRARVGVFVDVPFGFGKSRQELGIITSTFETYEGKYKLKTISGISEDYAPLPRDYMLLAEKMAKRYVCGTVSAYKTMLSPIKHSKIKLTMVKLLLSPDKAAELISGNTLRSVKQINIIKLLAEADNCEMEKNELLSIADGKQGQITALKEKGYIETFENVTENTEAFETAFAGTFENAEGCKMAEIAPGPELTEDQKNAVSKIEEEKQKGRTEFLLHGITGSGKTEVYFKLIENALKRGEGCIFLVPEIALTAQMIKRVKARFGENVCILHSKISPNERAKAHEMLRSGRVKLALGARSCVFAPVQNLKMIIVDEEQEPSYKSFEQLPYYNGAEVAKMRMEINGGMVIYGSATPKTTTFYRADTEEIGYFYLGKRARETDLPKIEIVDMKREQNNGSPISNALYLAIKENVERGEQTIIFVPRRGYSARLYCTTCGKTIGCRKCRVALSYHKKMGRVICHHCGNTSLAPTTCPYCGGKNLQTRTFGTEMIAETLEGLFPGKQVLRMDTDSTRTKDGHEKIISKFESENIPILVGTQMVAKGLDFPNVTLVGVADADSLVSIPEYDATERAFVLLTQVFGRAGRAENKPGRGILQTMDPSRDVFSQAAKQDYFEFYKNEIAFRETLDYPPFVAMATFTAYGTDDRGVYNTISMLRTKLSEAADKNGISVEILQITRSELPLINGKYYWNFVVKSQEKAAFYGFLQEFRENVIVPFSKDEKNKATICVDTE